MGLGRAENAERLRPAVLLLLLVAAAERGGTQIDVLAHAQEDEEDVGGAGSSDKVGSLHWSTAATSTITGIGTAAAMVAHRD